MQGYFIRFLFTVAKFSLRTKLGFNAFTFQKQSDISIFAFI